MSSSESLKFQLDDTHKKILNFAFKSSLQIFNQLVLTLEFEDVRSLLMDLNTPKEMLIHCLNIDGFAKNYVSYLAILPPSKDEHLIDIFRYCLRREEIDLKEVLVYPRSEKFLLFLYKEVIDIGNLKYADINNTAIKYQTLPKPIVQELWFMPKEGFIYRRNIMKHQLEFKCAANLV
jgi:hypothetical protein